MDLIEAADGSPQHRHPWETARLRVLHRLILGSTRLDDGATVIDIGCGDAFVAGELARDFPGATFLGIDSALTATAVAARQPSLPPNLRLMQSLDDLPAPPRPATLILLMDVLEHIEDDRAFLADLVSRPIVGPQTRLLITVPAYQSLFCSHDVFLKHFRRYSNRQLRNTLEGVGLRVDEIGYFFASLLPGRILQVIGERLTSRPPVNGTGLSEYSGGAIASSLMSGILAADAYSAIALRRLGITIPGLSNYAICRTSV